MLARWDPIAWREREKRKRSSMEGFLGIIETYCSRQSCPRQPQQRQCCLCELIGGQIEELAIELRRREDGWIKEGKNYEDLRGEVSGKTSAISYLDALEAAPPFWAKLSSVEVSPPRQ